MSRPVHTNFPPADPADFTPVLGGPLFQLFRKFHLTGDALELARRRILVLALVAWLPLLLPGGLLLFIVLWRLCLGAKRENWNLGPAPEQETP